MIIGAAESLTGVCPAVFRLTRITRSREPCSAPTLVCAANAATSSTSLAADSTAAISGKQLASDAMPFTYVPSRLRLADVE